MTSHVRIVRQRRSCRINGTHGISETLCGAAPTAMDMAPADAREDYRTTGWSCLACEKCRSLIERDEQQFLDAMGHTRD